MSVRNCIYPWHWMIVTHEGDVLPCGHGSRPVGNVRQQSADEIWNGTVMQELRASLLVGRVHAVCRSTDCPYQQQHVAFTPAGESPTLDGELARTFDEAWYLDAHPDVRVAVERRQFASGLEHFARHGCSEGRAYQLVSISRNAPRASAANATLALLEYARRATVLRSRPVDLVIQVSTICNLRCVMCPHGVNAVQRPTHMPLDVLARLRDFIGTAARMIVSGLGEPLLAPAFWRLIEECAGRDDVFIRANSNAQLINPGNASRLLDSGLKEISFSLDAASATTYSRIRGADFSRAVRGVETMCNTRRAHSRRSLEIFVNMTLMVENMAEAPRFVELAAQLGADAVLFSQLFPFGDEPGWRVRRAEWTFRYSEQMLAKAPEDATRYLDEAREVGRSRGVRIEFQSNTHHYLTTAARALAS